MSVSKVGTKMNDKIKNKLIDVLSNPKHEGKTQKEIANLVKVSLKTVQNYLTDETWKEIEIKRLKVIKNHIKMVDNAVFEKAINGDISAAKLIYKRWEETKFKTNNNLENNGNELEEIKRLEKSIQELENGKTAKT